MWFYEKRLQFPINIKKTDPRMAKYILSQYGGPDGELSASLRYLSQRFTMPCERSKAVLNDIGTYVSKMHIKTLLCSILQSLFSNIKNQGAEIRFRAFHNITLPKKQ